MLLSLCLSVCLSGQRVQRSCTALIASFFDGFDPEGVIADHFERWKGDPAASALLC